MTLYTFVSGEINAADARNTDYFRKYANSGNYGSWSGTNVGLPGLGPIGLLCSLFVSHSPRSGTGSGVRVGASVGNVGPLLEYLSGGNRFFHKDGALPGLGSLGGKRRK